MICANACDNNQFDSNRFDSAEFGEGRSITFRVGFPLWLFSFNFSSSSIDWRSQRSVDVRVNASLKTRKRSQKTTMIRGEPDRKKSGTRNSKNRCAVRERQVMRAKSDRRTSCWVEMLCANFMKFISVRRRCDGACWCHRIHFGCVLYCIYANQNDDKNADLSFYLSRSPELTKTNLICFSLVPSPPLHEVQHYSFFSLLFLSCSKGFRLSWNSSFRIIEYL